jgi:hypothetical protein
MRRILISLGLTILGLVVSWIFLRPHEWQTDSVNTKQSIAFVVDMNNDVSRQEEGRLLWSPIHTGDKIFAGDKIKTSGLSSTTIQFADSKSKLDIEENSIVVIALDQNKFSLNMLEGRVFVQGDEGKNSLNLMSAGKKIDYSGDTAISVSQSGESRVESFSQGNIFRDLKPAYSETLVSAKNEVELSWKPDGISSPVEVFVGESPIIMHKIPLNNSAFSTGKIAAEMRPGINYWQLSTVHEGKEVKSPLMKLVLNRPLPPTQIFPLHKEVVTGNDRAFDFKWNKGSSTGLTTIEVATTNDFKSPLIREEVRDQTFFTPDKILPEGDYFWKLSFTLPSGEKVESAVTSFRVHLGNGLLSPAPLLPADKAKFYLGANADTEVNFEWKRQENVSYTLKVKGENFSKEIDTPMNSASVLLNKSGSYQWEVSSRSSDGKVSVLPLRRTFDVRSQGKIPWVTEQKVYTYLENLPVIILRWQKTYLGSAVLKIAQTPDMKDSESFNVPAKDFPFRPANDGLYYARVQGLDDAGTPSAFSDIFEFEVKLAPIPPAPITENDKKTIIASSTGDFSVGVTNRKINWLLVAQLVDLKGGVMDERRFSENTFKFSGLLPGKYILRTNYQDEYNRKGEVSVLELQVPEKSKIPAPKLKGIKVR